MPIQSVKCIGAFAILFGCGVATSSCARLHESAAVDRLKPCHPADGPTDGYCGMLDVWEDRQAQSGRKIALKIVILPALKQDPAPDPLFFLAGGPGQGAAEMAGDLQESFRPIERDRDIVFVDQRGTGKSNPLNCKPEERDDNFADIALKRLPECVASYTGSADLTKYTTPIAMDDLDDVRRFLGYTRIDLYGVSYGARAAMVYTRRHPNSTRAVILGSVASISNRIPLYMARDAQRSLDLLLKDCEADAGCARRFPNLRDRLTTLLERLDRHPQNIHFVDPRTGLEKNLVVKRATLAAILFASLYSPETASLIPLLIEEADQGNFTGFIAVRSAFDSLSENMSLGLQYAVLCSEDAPQIDPADVRREAAGTFMGSEAAQLRLNACAAFPRVKIDPDYFVSFSSDTPALILSGQLDPVTPPSWGEEVASLWKNSRHVVAAGAGHGAWTSGCVMNMMAKFLSDGTASKLDTSCIERTKRPPFVLGPSGPDVMNGTRL